MRRTTAIITIICLLALAASARGGNVDFYSNAVIENGDVYNEVRVYDTPPEHTVVDMHGGSVGRLRTYDLSTANVYGGEISQTIETRDSSTLNIYAGIITLDYLAVSNSGILNIYGSDLIVGNSPYFSDSSTVNIYGYGFTYGSSQLKGFLSDGSPFLINECFQSDYANITLIEVPKSPTTYYVNAADGSDDNDGLSPETAFATIQKAIDAAYDGDTVIVADGTYTGEGNRDIDFLGKAITVKSENGPENCIIDCNGYGGGQRSAFCFDDNEGVNSVLDGFTITNGSRMGYGMIFCRNSGPRVNNCVITGNVAGRPPNSGGIHCLESKPIISNCTITSNMPSGIYLRDCSAIITNCTIAENESTGIYCEGSQTNNSLAISNCTVSENEGYGIFLSGGGLEAADCLIAANTDSGMRCDGADATIKNCIITDNAASQWGGGGIRWSDGTATIINCIISDNTAEWGGGVSCHDANLIMESCIVTDNTAQSPYAYGGGIFCASGSQKITNCTIGGNTADEGGGIYCLDSSVRVDMCRISGNCSLVAGDWPWVIRGGGGVYCEDGSLTITDSTIADNTADGNFSGGGAILCGENTELEIIGCTIRGNSAKGGGGGVYCDYDTVATISGCKIIGNSSESYSGGIRCGWDTQTKIHNCLVTGNSAKDAGGISYASRERPDITNCTIANNIARDGYGGGIVIMTPKCDAALENCILWGNSAEDGEQIALVGCPCSRWCSLTANNCNIEGGPEAVYTLGYGHWELDWDNGNIDVNPCFVGPGYWDVNGVWVEGDYRLLVTSRCIDAGDPNYVPEPDETDLDGNPRVLDGDEDGTAVVDMGAYELWPAIEAEMKLTPQTVNCSSKGKFIKAHILLPEGILAEAIDVNAPAVADPPDIDSEYIRILGGDTGPVKLEIGFRQSAFCEALAETGEIEITVTGLLTTGQEFYATDTIKIKAQSPHRRSH